MFVWSTHTTAYQTNTFAIAEVSGALVCIFCTQSAPLPRARLELSVVNTTFCEPISRRCPYVIRHRPHSETLKYNIQSAIESAASELSESFRCLFVPRSFLSFGISLDFCECSIQVSTARGTVHFKGYKLGVIKLSRGLHLNQCESGFNCNYLATDELCKLKAIISNSDAFNMRSQK